MGAYHTIDLELNRKFTLIKEEWDSIDLERIETITDPTQVFKLSNFKFLFLINIINCLLILDCRCGSGHYARRFGTRLFDFW